MTCSEVQEVLPELLDVPAEGTFPAEFQSHLKGCSDCSELVSDLRSITSEAPQLVASHEPSPLLWLRISAQLRSEGLIRDQETATEYQKNFQSFKASPRPWWKLSWLVPVAAVLLVAGTYVVKHQSAPMASKQTPPPAVNRVNADPVPPATAAVVPAPPADAANIVAPVSEPRQVAQAAAAKNIPAALESPEVAGNGDDEQFLSVVSTRAPSMRSSYEKQLKAVNADIKETQAYVDQNPGDPDAREHLMDSFQQKALLYQIALDRIQ